jgi:hypothetical protein
LIDTPTSVTEQALVILGNFGISMCGDGTIVAAPGVRDGFLERGEARLNSKGCESSEARPLRSQTANDGPMSEGKASVPGQMSDEMRRASLAVAEIYSRAARARGEVTFPPDHKFEFHKLCSAFPLMTGDEFAELVADIKQHGQREPVTLCRGQILDGRCRYLACRELGIGMRAVERKIADPVAFVVSANVRRRHLSTEQKRSLIAQLLKDHPTRSDRATAKVVGVDHKTVAAVRS